MNPDSIQLHLSSDSLAIFNFCMALVIFGVSLDLDWGKFIRVLRRPRLLIVGLFSQILLLPAATFLLIYLVKPYPSLGLGMLLVACCPGGSVSNFYTYLARGNVALSISLTAVSTLLSPLLTPLNFALYQELLAGVQPSSERLYIPFREMVYTVSYLIIVPVSLGILCRYYLPWLTARMKQPLKLLSLIIFSYSS
ncbi:MAG: hypothetical protein HC880_06825 [Bacteroidia bacterium]|nr:hypothetical protein [Bacteroidia bacterium]